jgi:bifunctional non-homologous end joining protein LigD
MTEDLQQYRDKRDLQKSGEPAAERTAGEGPLMFVVQKHSARRLHYDLRLEVDGVLKSWAVPKGPSLDPSQKRLAAMVEDHPLDYASFEGVIPKGEYGAGQVIVWDSGTYSPDEGNKFLFDDREGAQAEMRKGIKEGKISFFLRGRKLKGSWTLVKVRAREKDWLLIKHRDEFAGTDHDILTEERSVLSDRSIDDLKQGVSVGTSDAPTTDPRNVEGAQRSDFPGFVPPMLASLADAPFSNPSWVFEPKLDGYRIIAAINNGDVRLWSRRGNDVTDRYGSFVPALRAQPASELVLDGEMVAIDEAGHVSFERLQQYLENHGIQEDGRQIPLIYYVFDILYLDGYDLRSVALAPRKRLLRDVLLPSADVRLVDYFEADGKSIFEAAVKNGLEGVVGKKIDSVYSSGRRSPDWLKVKGVKTDDFVIGGYTAGEGSRSGSLGALLLGYRDEKNRLTYAGHVGSGFNEQTLASVKERLDELKTEQPPFAPEPKTNTAPTWVRPELVAEVKYSQWTRDGRLRSPVFLRLRDDKPAAEAGRADVISAPRDEPSTRLDVVADLVEQLSNKKESLAMEVDGHKITLGNLEKELWPATDSQQAVTKRLFLKYLARVSPHLLPHLRDRPITLSRYPHGIHGQHFWQKHWSLPIPDYVTTVNISEEAGKQSEYIVCDNVSTLMWLGQAADIEFHTWFSRTEIEPDIHDTGMAVDRILDYPDFIVFDLDPYVYSGKEKTGEEPEFNQAGFDKACDVARRLKDVLDGLSLNSFIKTSGKTGLHIYVPIVRKLEFSASRRAAETLGQFLLQRYSDDITMEWAVGKRTGKVFIDYAQNVRGKTLASIYSPRPYDGATVSFPLRWEDLGKTYPSDYTILTVPDLLAQHGDLWRGILNAKKDITQSLGIE